MALLVDRLDENILKKIHNSDLKNFMTTSISTVPYCVYKLVVAPAGINQEEMVIMFHHTVVNVIATCVNFHDMVRCKYPCELKKVSWLNNPIWYRNPFSIEGIPADYLTNMIHNRLVESGYDPSKYGENYFYPSIAFVNRGDNWFENNDDLI